MTESGRPSRTLIYGSCVSRDTFEHLDERFQLSLYVARQSWISADNAVPNVAASLRPISSPFQHRMVHGDLSGDVLRRMTEHSEALDLVLLDLVDERGGVIEFSDGYVTKLAEYWSSGGKEVSRGRRHVPFGTDQHFALWAAAADRVLGHMSECGLLSKTVLLHAPWAESDEDGDALAIPQWMIRPADANRMYERYVLRLEQAGVRVLRLPTGLAVSSKTHRWGTSPFHYAEAAYEYWANALVGFVE